MTATAVHTDRLLPLTKFTAAQEFTSAAYKAGLDILGASSFDELYPRVVEEFAKLIGAQYASIYQIINGELQKVYTSFPKLNDIKPRKNGFTYKAYHDAVPYVLDNSEVFSIHPEIKNLAIPSTLFIPLTFQNESLGVLSIDFAEKKKFSSETIEILQMLGSIITYKMQNLGLYTELTQIAESQKLFISLASHEIKNPLTTIKAYGQVLKKQIQAGNPIKISVIEKLVSETDRIVALTNELLINKSSQVDEIILHYQKHHHNLREIVAHAITNFKLNHPKRSVHFTNKCKEKENDLIYGDYHKLLQMISNILNNAAKFSAQTTKIAILLKLEDKTLILKISDKGKGIAPEDIPHIFERYFKGKITKKEGMGLGLYLCKKIVKEHSGTIEVSSKLGKGTSVVIKLPHVV